MIYDIVGCISRSYIYIYHPQITMFAGWSHFCWLKAIDNMMDVRDIYLNVYPCCILYHLYRIVHAYIIYHIIIMYHISYIIHLAIIYLAIIYLAIIYLAIYIYGIHHVTLLTCEILPWRGGLHTDLPRWVHEGWGCHWTHPRYGECCWKMLALSGLSENIQRHGKMEHDPLEFGVLNWFRLFRTRKSIIWSPVQEHSEWENTTWPGSFI